MHLLRLALSATHADYLLNHHFSHTCQQNLSTSHTHIIRSTFARLARYMSVVGVVVTRLRWSTAYSALANLW